VIALTASKIAAWVIAIARISTGGGLDTVMPRAVMFQSVTTSARAAPMHSDSNEAAPSSDAARGYLLAMFMVRFLVVAAHAPRWPGPEHRRGTPARPDQKVKIAESAPPQ